ncbi:hypothetical protein [Miltoncostaea oceani]|uniref:hypothetical protein n=1 Tax=Miltoncostaea oceani TaxID=2843216 RepID=UPI001C3CE169|nr:hypothetical protein [Miltoncostaea oceani]
MITGASVVYLSACDWDAPWHGPQEIAARLGAVGNRVIYVETLAWRRLRPSDARRAAGRVARGLAGRRRSAPAEVAPAGVEIVSPLLVPGARSRPARALNRTLLARTLRRRMGPDDHPRLLWIYTPSRASLDLVGDLGEDLVLYHCTQSHPDRPTAPPETRDVERRLITAADLVVVDGIELQRERAPLHPHVHRIPSGVDPEAYTSGVTPAAWTTGLRRPVIGYLGSVDHRIDPDLLTAVAAAFPGATVAVVGPVTDVDVTALRAMPNVVIHPQVPIAAVPGVLAAFDVGLLPYADQPMTRYTYPAKLHQYLAAGLPIASVPLPDLEEFADLVQTGTGPAGFVDGVSRALAAPVDADARRAVARVNSWAHRVEELSRVIAERLAARSGP